MPQPHDAIHHEEVLKDFCPPRKICFFTKSSPPAIFRSIMKQRLERLSCVPGIRTFFAQRLECGLLKPFCRQRPNVGSPRAFERKTGALLLWMVSSLVVPECALRKTFFAITKPRLFIEHLLNKLISNACISEKGTPWQALPFPLQL